MRFAIIGSRGYPSTYGGFETLVRRLAPYLVKHGDEVCVYCRSVTGTDLRPVVDGVTRVFTRGINTSSLSTLSHGFAASRHAAQAGYDAALILNVANGYYLRAISAGGTPIVVNVDGIEWERDKWNGLGRAVFRVGAHLTAKYASTIVADSKAIGEIWQTMFHRRSTFVPYGADVLRPPTASDRLKHLGIPSLQYALAVARLAPENNVGLFLESLRYHPDLPAVIVGSGSPRSEITKRLQRLARERPNTHWLGHVNDQELLSQLFANCLMYVHGHSAGGTNPALLQALGSGAPTLALATVYNAEVVDNEAQLFERDSWDLANRMKILRNDDELRRTISKQGQEIVRTRYKWADVLAAYRALLHNAASSSRGGRSE